ncbi:MAG: flagellar basal-body rod protein FlgG [Gammaproteobacteria bacterium]|nr:flagellar basal-body rod protein FlgG [Gammaproteobacteria bacterium]MDH5800528.1 flagellar basal-body rod protein FlgG [Gammaproteobacteria bacterium]
MTSALWVAKTGLDAQQTKLSVISNNLANVNTIGYKKSRAVFEDLLYQNVRQAGAQVDDVNELPSGFSLGTGVRTVATEKIHSQGNLIQTDKPLDIAISGRGFFQILRPDGGIGYTRDGGFQVNSSGQMVTSGGLPLQPAITLPANTLTTSIGADGTVSVVTAGSTSPTVVGNIQIAEFINASGLQPIGENMYLETGSSGAPQVGTPGLNGIGSLLQGELESSNVNVVKEMVDMIETQRAYEVNTKAISTADQMLQYLNNNV